MTLWVRTSTAVSREMPLLSGEQHAFGKRQHLHGEAQVGGDLHRNRQAVVAHMGDLGADVFEQRLNAIEGFPAAADHDGKFSLLQSDGAARYRSIHHVRAFFADLGSHLLAFRRAAGGHVDQNFAGGESGEKAIRAFGDVFHGGSVGDHGEDEVGSLSNFARGIAPLHSLLDEPFGFGARAVVPGDLMSFADKTRDHMAAHDAETDVPNICHSALAPRPPRRVLLSEHPTRASSAEIQIEMKFRPPRGRRELYTNREVFVSGFYQLYDTAQAKAFG